MCFETEGGQCDYALVTGCNRRVQNDELAASYYETPFQ